MEREYTDDKRRALLSRAGLYYELHEDYPHALECYTEAKDHNKASELPIRSAERHPGMSFYRETEQYYRAPSAKRDPRFSGTDAEHEYALCAERGL